MNTAVATPLNGGRMMTGSDKVPMTVGSLVQTATGYFVVCPVEEPDNLRPYGCITARHAERPENHPHPLDPQAVIAVIRRQ